MDEFALDLSGIQDPVTARVTDLIRLSQAFDKAVEAHSHQVLEAALTLVLHDLKQIVLHPVVLRGDNVVQFPGGRDVH